MKKTSLKKISYDVVWELKRLSQAQELTIDEFIRELLEEHRTLNKRLKNTNIGGSN